jgi:hypothetical protein
VPSAEPTGVWKLTHSGWAMPTSSLRWATPASMPVPSGEIARARERPQTFVFRLKLKIQVAEPGRHSDE